MKKNKIGAMLAAGAVLSLLAGCTSAGSGDGGVVTLRVAALDGGYGTAMYTELAAAYEKLNPGINVEFQTSKNLGEELTPQVASGDYPDVVFLSQGGEAGFTDSFVRDKNVEDLTGVLDLKVPGEDVTVGDKLTDGIVGNLSTNPYGDDKVYLMPLYASPVGLVYNKTLFEEKGWTLPTTWDEMFALGDEAKAEGISLFTYPIAGYLDSYFQSLLATVGGEPFYRDVMTYKSDVWDDDAAKETLSLTAKLLSYAAPTTVGYANGQDFKKNQQTILDGTVLFMPNGSWISNEMADAPRTDGFAWGMTTVPALEAGDDRYLATFVDSAWVPTGAVHKDEAKQFIAYLYSDEAAAIFSKTGAIQPIKGLADTLTGDAKVFYSTYDEPGVKALVGGFAATKPVQGVDIKNTLYETANSVIAGTATAEEWGQKLNEANNRLTGQIAN